LIICLADTPGDSVTNRVLPHAERPTKKVLQATVGCPVPGDIGLERYRRRWRYRIEPVRRSQRRNAAKRLPPEPGCRGADQGVTVTDSGERAAPGDIPGLISLVDEVGKRRQDDLERRVADQRLVDEVCMNGFRGPTWRELETKLIQYGMATLKAWMYTGYIFLITANNGMPLNPSMREKRLLKEDRDMRSTIAGHTVAVTLPKFKERAIRQGGWTFEGGASLTTYFVGAAAYEFPNEFRRWRRNCSPPDEEEPGECVIDLRADHPDPAILVLGRIHVEETLALLRPREAAIVRLNLVGYSHEEIAEMVSDSTIRAVEGVLYRWRKAERDRRMGSSDRDGGGSRGRP
jgi:DNA-directed RNA polymerase specialized sigma24 family protein